MLVYCVFWSGCIVETRDEGCQNELIPAQTPSLPFTPIYLMMRMMLGGRGREWKYKKMKIRGLLGLGEYINCQLKIPKVKMKRVEGVCTDADSPPWGRDGWIQWPRFLRVCQLAKKPECLICKNYHKCVFHVLWKNIANVERGKFVNLFAFWCRNTCTMKYLMKRKPCFSKIQILSSFKGLPPCDLSALKKSK